MVAVEPGLTSTRQQPNRMLYLAAKTRLIIDRALGLSVISCNMMDGMCFNAHAAHTQKARMYGPD